MAKRIIIVTVRGGLVQSVEGIPDGVAVEVRDLDTESGDEERIEQTEDGPAYVTTFEAE